MLQNKILENIEQTKTYLDDLKRYVENNNLKAGVYLEDPITIDTIEKCHNICYTIKVEMTHIEYVLDKIAEVNNND